MCLWPARFDDEARDWDKARSANAEMSINLVRYEFELHVQKEGDVAATFQMVDESNATKKWT